MLQEKCKECKWYQKDSSCSNSNWMPNGYFYEKDPPDKKCPTYQKLLSLTEWLDLLEEAVLAAADVLYPTKEEK